MQSVVKNKSTDYSSEIISSSESDSESSSSAENTYGAGDEAVTIPAHASNTLSKTPRSEATSPLCHSPVKEIVGIFCALTAIGGSIMCLYASTHQDQHGAIKADVDRVLLGVGLPMIAIGSMVAVKSFVNNA